MAFTKDSIKQLLADLRPTLMGLAESSGSTLKLGTMRWDPVLAKVTIEFHAQNSETGEDENAKREWAMYHSLYDLGLEDFGRTFTNPRGIVYRIVGVKPRATRMPIICEEVATGRKFKFESKAVAWALAAEATRKL